MKKQNGKNILVKFGKSILLTIFSVFVIFITIIAYCNYEYNTIIISKYNNYYLGNKDKEKNFYDNVAEIYSGYKNAGSSLSMNLFLATILISENKANIKIIELEKNDIHTIFKCMNSNADISDFSQIIYDEEAFRVNIKEKWLKQGNFEKITKNYSDKQLDGIVDDIFTQKKLYEELYGEKSDVVNTNSSAAGGVCSYKVNDKNYSNVRVKLMSCEGKKYLGADEEFDLETYIIGVVRQENGNGPYEALKAQAVASRSFTLVRPSRMGGAYGVKLESVGNETLISLRSCTNDQVFCNPDKGCWSNVRGGQTSNSNPGGWANCTVHSGYDKTKTWSVGKLDDNSDIRKAVKETTGQVALDSKGNVVNTDFTDTNQQYWNRLAKKGLDYFEILKKDYKSIATIKSTCTAGESTELGKAALEWKQCDSRWGSDYIWRKTICQIGCMVTSTSIQIARSGTQINVKDFNPGVFVKEVRKNNGFTGNNFNVDDSTWASIAPNFKVAGMIDFKKDEKLKNKMSKMQELISQGYYVIARIYHPGQHWVAITNVENNKATMADPSTDATSFCDKYDCSGSKFGRIYYFKAS